MQQSVENSSFLFQNGRFLLSSQKKILCEVSEVKVLDRETEISFFELSFFYILSTCLSSASVTIISSDSTERE